LKERLVIWKNIPKFSSKTIWFHCASIGEVRAIEPLFPFLKKDNISIVLTVVTKTARQYASEIKDIDYLSLFPIDIYPLTLKAFNLIKPSIFAPIETEIWPSLLYVAHSHKVKIIGINGRISQKTFKVYKFLSFFWGRFINLMDIVLARSEEDAKHYKALSNNKVETIISGNIKYDRDFNSNIKKADFNLAADDIVLTAGSIREGEEKLIIDAYKTVSKKLLNLKFFLAPRHLNAISLIKQILSDNNIPFSLFSELKSSGKPLNNFIIVDVFGKLQDIYSISDLCFIGGSLINKGGQNPIEAAAFAKPVLFGKYMDNFKTESSFLINGGGALTVADEKDLANLIIMLLADKQKLSDMGKRALQTVQSQRGSIKLTIEKLRELL
jgi:3-deoxy-D-manno-octulosonic-acid transferase